MNNVISNYGGYLRTFSTCSYIGRRRTIFHIRDYTRRAESTFSNHPVIHPKFMNSLSLSRATTNIQYHTFIKQHIFSDKNMIRREY